MFNAGAIVGEMILDVTQWKNNIAKVKADAKSLEGFIMRNASGIQKLGVALTAVGTGITLLNTKLVQMSMQVQESENLFNESMASMKDEARTWSNEIAKSLRMSQYEVRNTLGVFNVMLKSMGLTTEQAYSMSRAMTQLSYDMASFYNLDPTETFRRLQSGISGEIEPLRRLGIVVNETAVKTWALNNGMIKQGQDLTETQKVWARFFVIMEGTKAAQGDLIRTQNSLTNLVRAFNAKLKELGTTLGNTLLPTLSKVFELLMKTTVTLNDFANHFPELTKVIVITTAAFGLLALVVGPLLIMLPGLATAAAALEITMGTLVGTTTLWTGGITLLGIAVYELIKNFDYVKAVFFSFAEGVNRGLAQLTESLARLADKAASFPKIGDKFKGLGEDLRNMSSEFTKSADLMSKKATDSLIQYDQTHQAVQQNVQSGIATTQSDFDKMIQDMKNGMNSIALDSKTPLQEWTDNLKASFDWAQGMAENTYTSMANSFSGIFVDAFNKELKSASDYFKQFMNSIINAMFQMVAQWLAMKIILGIVGGAAGSAAGSAATSSAAASSSSAAAGSFAEGIDYVPSTGLYRLHAGEKVTPKYDNVENSSAKQTNLTIYNLITNDSVARAMQSREGSNVIVNVMNVDNMRNGASKRTVKGR